MKIGRFSVPAFGTTITIENIEGTLEELKELFTYQPTPSPAQAVRATTIQCDHFNECTNRYEKCKDCGNNTAKSYFTPKKK